LRKFLKNKKFKLDSGFSPFSYFTTIAFHAFINRIKKEKKHNEAINEYKSRFYEEELNNNSDINIYVKPDGYGDDEVPDNASSTNE
jgi:DNA-directed RNA polymerase specialized sigma24 family protein